MQKQLIRGLLLMAVLVGCHGEPSSSTTSQQDGRLNIQMALFFAPDPAVDPVAGLRELCSRPATGFRLIEAEKDLAGPLPAVAASWAPLKKYAPPDEKSWPYRTRDLPMKDVRPGVVAGSRVLVLDFYVSRRDAVEANRRIGLLMSALADATGGLPWDEESRRLFSAAAWRKSRVDSWYGGIPDMREQIVMDEYRDGEFLRVVTLGMRKFALPDLVADGVTYHISRNIGHTVNACAQTLVEGGVIRDKRLTLNFASIRHPAVRETMQAKPGPGATGRSVVSLTPARPEQGDADNILLDIDFPVTGSGKQERQQAAMAALFGSTDSITKVRSGDPELNAARDRARRRLPELRQRFMQGLEPSEHIVVKGPFHINDGRTEYMWVEVSRWSGSTIRGILTNDPFWVKGLKAGSRVTVREDDVFDYIWRRPDGTELGNETGAILRKRELQGR
jgi:uncharacterized protein YegJ (DUF2314 family)